MRDALKRLPSVDRLLRHPALAALREGIARPTLLRAVREVLEEARREIRESGDDMTERPEASSPSAEELVRRAASRAAALDRPWLRSVINATGIVVHTNLGRSLLSPAAVRALETAASHYVNLEYDLGRGARSSRQAVVREILTGLTGAPDALVVNNNAAAVLVVLNTLAEGKEAIISRGELVEIGGSFRMPDVMAKSGARMVEVGTTNRTRLADYQEALGPETALLVKVHPSNFVLRGFVEEATVAELSRWGRLQGIPTLYDLGSGALLDLRKAGLPHEPTAQEALADGASVVTFSGDKLLGGPQAGIILGEQELLQRVARNPLMRPLRVDKLTLAALEATLTHYRDEGEGALTSVPTLALVGAGEGELARRAKALAARLRRELAGRALVDVVPGQSEAGGGALPDQPLPTTQVRIQPLELSAEEVAASLRRAETPVIALIREEGLLLDLRTVLPAQLKDLARGLGEALGTPRSSPEGRTAGEGSRDRRGPSGGIDGEVSNQVS